MKYSVVYPLYYSGRIEWLKGGGDWAIINNHLCKSCQTVNPIQQANNSSLQDGVECLEMMTLKSWNLVLNFLWDPVVGESRHVVAMEELHNYIILSELHRRYLQVLCSHTNQTYNCGNRDVTSSRITPVFTLKRSFP